MLLKQIIIVVISIVLSLHLQGQNLLSEKTVGSIKSYVDCFNKVDNELYVQCISNEEAVRFLIDNIPFFECPDKSLEKTYYFRWWSYRKHVKKTPVGYVITEFLPDVPWAGTYNTISCAAIHHFYEGRWLRNDTILSDYANFWFSEYGNPRLYSFGAADAIYKYYLVHDDLTLLKNLYPKLKNNFLEWEEEKRDSTRLFWQTDDRDGMEMSVSGQLSVDASGYRPSINSYMYGEAFALSKIAYLVGNQTDVFEFAKQADEIKYLINSKLWDEEDGFYKVIPKNEVMAFCSDRELIGYLPWLYDIPPVEYLPAWKQLFDTEGFEAVYGPTTVEQRSPHFSISYEGHECQWNGPSWPYLTSLILTAAANVLHADDDVVSFFTVKDYLKILSTYSNSQRLITEDKSTICWVDENLNPYTGDWLSRTRLKSWKNDTWDEGKGGVERGKDYNHSSFCNLIISGLMGVSPQLDGTVVVDPLIPDGYWDYFCLANIYCKGNFISVIYDKTGDRYGLGKGFMIYVNDQCVLHSSHVKKHSLKIPLE